MKCIQEKIGTNIAPNDYSKEDKKKWDDLYEKKYGV